MSMTNYYQIQAALTMDQLNLTCCLVLTFKIPAWTTSTQNRSDIASSPIDILN